MTRDSLNDEPAPSGPLYARLSAETPGVGTQRGEGGLSGPQAGIQRLDPRVVLLDTITTALNAAGFWLAIEGRRAIADAVVEQAGKERAAASRVRGLHQQYRFAGDDTTDYCAHCNQIGGGWIAWPCPTITALDEPPKEQA